VIQEVIRDSNRTFEIREFIEKGRHYGMQTFDQALLALVNRGAISWEVALTAASSPGDLDLQRRMGVDGEEEEMRIEEHQRYADSDVDGHVELTRAPVEQADLGGEPDKEPSDVTIPEAGAADAHLDHLLED
jgi:hypothetical protein